MKRKLSQRFIVNQATTMLLDYIIVVVSTFLALIISRPDILKTIFSQKMLLVSILIVNPFVYITIAYFFNIYAILWKYADIISYLRIVVASAFSVGITFVAYVAIQQPELKKVPIEIIFLSILFITLFETVAKYIPHYRDVKSKDIDESIHGNIMVIGAGNAGSLLVNDIKNNTKHSYCKVKCIVDDDKAKIGKSINGVTVEGDTGDIISLVEKHDIDIIVLAIPSCSSERKAAILNLCQKTECKIRIIPSYYQLVDKNSESSVNMSALREVQIEDLLGREPIDIKVESVLDYVSGQVVLVTGGGGSIGSELCRQISKHSPKKLIIFDIYENNAYDIQNELLRENPDMDLTVLIGSVRDENRLDGVFEKYKPQIVFHAAAHKHVPLMEDSPNESIKNNVFGTFNTAKCSDKYGVKKFILISTDKAVNPTNIMGASKRICEMIIQYFSHNSKTEFAAVRFGNVLGSNGSVIPLFKKQIAEGGPVTVTDANIIRYFMTIPEAVSLVLQAGATAKGGEIFVLDMGEPVKIIDLAENLIRLSGYKPYTEIKIEFIGLRPGEKMYEEKLLMEEGLKRTSNSLIHIGKPIIFDENEFIKTLKKLKISMADDESDIRSLVKSIVPTYTYNG